MRHIMNIGMTQFGDEIDGFQQFFTGADFVGAWGIGFVLKFG